MSNVKVFIGTNNKAKFADAIRVAEDYPNLDIVGPADFEIAADPEETGDTYYANAKLKRDFFINALRQLGKKHIYVIGDDGGIEIDALNGEPGIHSRRWKDSQNAMTDQEIIDYALERMANVPEPDRTAHFAGVIALGHTDFDLDEELPFRLTGTLLTEPVSKGSNLDGYPFRRLFYMPNYEMMLSELSDLAVEDRPDGFLSHRELGLQRAFDAILELEQAQ